MIPSETNNTPTEASKYYTIVSTIVINILCNIYIFFVITFQNTNRLIVCLLNCIAVRDLIIKRGGNPLICLTGTCPKSLDFNRHMSWSSLFNDLIGYGYGGYRHFQQYFSYIVAISFIVGRNRSTRIKPLTCRKSLTVTNFITFCCIEYTSSDRNSISQRYSLFY